MPGTSQQERATPSGPAPPPRDTTFPAAAALPSRRSRNTMTSVLIRPDSLASEQPLISGRFERREEGTGLRMRTGRVRVGERGGRAAPQHAGLSRGWTWGGLATTPRVPCGLAGNSVPVFGLAGVSPSLGMDAFPRRPQVTCSGRPFPSRQSLSSREPQGDCPGCHVLCLMDLVPTATASEALIKGRVEALPAS